MVGSVPPEVYGAAAAVIALGGASVAVVVVVVRRVRDRLRAVRSSPGVRSAVALVGAARAGWGPQGGPTRLRVELWQAVSAAARALRSAEEAGGALADLPGLCRRLHATASELDGLLAVAVGLPTRAGEVEALRGQVEEVLRAATAVRLAALASAGDATALRVGVLAADASCELEAVAAGVARSRAAAGWD